MKDGGFDCIIGNPPWLMAGYYMGEEVNYVREGYRTARGKFDLYYVFIERALSLAKGDGDVGMIVPNKFFHTKSAAELRGLLSERKCLREVVDFGDQRLFQGATNYSCLLFFPKAQRGASGISKPMPDSWCGDKQVWPRLRKTRGILNTLDGGTFWKDLGSGGALESMVACFGTGVQSGAIASAIRTRPGTEGEGHTASGAARMGECNCVM